MVYTVVAEAEAALRPDSKKNTVPYPQLIRCRYIHLFRKNGETLRQYKRAFCMEYRSLLQANTLTNYEATKPLLISLPLIICKAAQTCRVIQPLLW
jgi:hypothetical protein